MDDDEEENSMLVSVAEKSLQQRCKPQSPSYCPSMDLVAVATVDEQLQVFRLNGQRVFGTSYASSNLKIGKLQWKPNGYLLAVACSDNTLRLFSSFSGKVVHQLSCEASRSPLDSKISCLGWGVNFTDTTAARKELDSANGELSVETLLAQTSKPINAQHIHPDLPRALALLDIEGALPKMSTLPSTGDENDIFSSRVSLDSIFHSVVSNNDIVDILLAGFEDGTVHLRLFDSFDIGTFNIADSLNFHEKSVIIHHASHPLTSTHCAIVATNEKDQQVLRMVTLDLKFISNSGRYLSLLASKSTQLQNLLRYITQVQEHILREWKTSQDLPARFLRNINEDLQEKCQCDFEIAAYHLVVTGDCSEIMKEFLVDQVGERGHKRWEKAVLTGYETIRRLTHECLLPALERCTVLLSRLQGLSRFHSASQLLGLDSRKLADVLAVVDTLGLLANQILLQSSQELRQFVCFAKWLRQEIDFQAADPTSSASDDILDRNENIDYAQILDYIRGALTKSGLLHFFRLQSKDEVAPEYTLNEGDSIALYNDYKKALQSKTSRKWPTELKSLQLNDLTAHLGINCQKVFNQIAETQRRSILISSSLSLSADCDYKVIDSRMLTDANVDLTSSSIYIAAKSVGTPSRVYLYHIILKVHNGVSSVKNVSAASMDFASADVNDFKFVDDDSMMLLISWQGQSRIVSLSYQENHEDGFVPPYRTCSREYDPSRSEAYEIDLEQSAVAQEMLRHTFAVDKNRVPRKLEVNGRKDRRVVCVLYEDMLHYSVFDLDSSAVVDDGAVQENGEDDDGVRDADRMVS